jgi:hypothetical protein
MQCQYGNCRTETVFVPIILNESTILTKSDYCHKHLIKCNLSTCKTRNNIKYHQGIAYCKKHIPLSASVIRDLPKYVNGKRKCDMVDCNRRKRLVEYKNRYYCGKHIKFFGTCVRSLESHENINDSPSIKSELIIDKTDLSIKETDKLISTIINDKTNLFIEGTCEAYTCTNTELIKGFNGSFCKKHLRELIKIRLNKNKNHLSINAEIVWRLAELNLRKNIDCGHINRIRKLIQYKNESV